MDDLYHQQILELYKNPLNFGELADADFTIHETNASCGDSYTYFIKLSSNKKTIENLSFTGEGCAISKAASSLATESLKGQPVASLQKLKLEYMQDLIGAQITPTRQKCLLLPVRALKQIA
jgi:nitrogen fixation protein NifU and related proteins